MNRAYLIEKLSDLANAASDKPVQKAFSKDFTEQLKAIEEVSSRNGYLQAINDILTVIHDAP